VPTLVLTIALATRRSRRAGAPRAVPNDRACLRGTHGRRRSNGCLCPGAAARSTVAGVEIVAASVDEQHSARAGRLSRCSLQAN
jgi:hypothetical protein